MPTDVKKVTKSISLNAEDLDYLRNIAKKYALLGDSATIRFILNAYREIEKGNADR